ncbi:MAG TPA: hypothetical protein VFA90_00155 [Terriglobales bacterium]|nr:hypothetical protein [Terriglobales bacterium]
MVVLLAVLAENARSLDYARLSLRSNHASLGMTVWDGGEEIETKHKVPRLRVVLPHDHFARDDRAEVVARRLRPQGPSTALGMTVLVWWRGDQNQTHGPSTSYRAPHVIRSG